MNKFSGQELKYIAENYTNAQFGTSSVVRKILEHIEKEKEKTEYSKSEVTDRSDRLEALARKKEFDLNETGSVRIIESIDSQSYNMSYINTLIKQNSKMLNETLNGIQGSD